MMSSVTRGTDMVFKALADPTRRHLLDRLHEREGQTLGELCAHLAMARQSVTQHLGVLEDANLVSTARRGRERWHYLNPVPIQEMQERWIDKFDRPRLRALADLKQRAEDPAMTENPARPGFVYVTYVESTPERVWHALTDADLTAAYWGHRNVSDWRPGSTWEHRRTDGSEVADVVGTVLEAEPPRRLVVTFGVESPSTVTFAIDPWEGIVRLTVTHVDLPTPADREAVELGWPAVMANLKSMLETGHVLPRAPWEMPERV